MTYTTQNVKVGQAVPFTEKLIFIDVETANKKGNICQIGAIVCNDGVITKIIDILINPNAEFAHDKTHTGLHGINEETVKNSPTLKEVWEQYFGFYSSEYIFVGHNIKSADSTWILQDLKRYGINLKCIYCYDTIELARRYIAKERFNNNDYKLSTLCKCLNIEYDILHNALEDTIVCFELFCYILQNNEVDLRRYYYPKRLPLTIDEERTLNKLRKQLYEITYKTKILKEFRKAVKEQNNELAFTLSTEHSPNFVEDIELHQLLVGIPDDAIYTNEEVKKITAKINELQQKKQIIQTKIKEIL